MQFSDHKKQMLVGKYPTEFRELVNAHLYESQARVDNLCGSYEADKMKISDLQALVGLAQDFVAAYQIMNFGEIPLQASGGKHRHLELTK